VNLVNGVFHPLKSDLILFAFITGNSSLEPLIEGLWIFTLVVFFILEHILETLQVSDSNIRMVFKLSLLETFIYLCTVAVVCLL
jgi:hypothetical protein